MTCRCGYEFCWLCEGDYHNHDSNRCNKFTSDRQAGNYTVQEREKILAHQSVVRLQHYFNRFMDHGKSIEFAYKKREKLRAACQMLT